MDVLNTIICVVNLLLLIGIAGSLANLIKSITVLVKSLEEANVSSKPQLDRSNWDGAKPNPPNSSGMPETRY